MMICHRNAESQSEKNNFHPFKRPGAPEWTTTLKNAAPDYKG
jgi:hypothetical protein